MIDNLKRSGPAPNHGSAEGRFSGSGFTLIEIFVAVAVFAVVALMGMPVINSLQSSYALRTETRAAINVLRRAQTRAFVNKDRSAFGVRLAAGDELILFKGDSFEIRDSNFDEVYPISSPAVATGTNEVVFSALSGSPVATSSWSITVGNDINTISVDRYGSVSW